MTVTVSEGAAGDILGSGLPAGALPGESRCGANLAAIQSMACGKPRPSFSMTRVMALYALLSPPPLSCRNHMFSLKNTVPDGLRSDPSGRIRKLRLEVKPAAACG